MHFKENLRLLRRLNDVSQDELAAKFGYKSFTTVQKWEDGTSMPSMKRIQQLADYFGVNMERFINDDLNKETVKQVQVPVMGTVKTGLGLLAEQNVVDYEYVSKKETNGGEYFFLNVVGDSMKNARIMEGDRVYIRRQDTVNNRDIAVCLLENNEVTLKRVIFKGNKLILQPENDAYEPMVFTQKDVENKKVQIIGKLIYNKIEY